MQILSIDIGGSGLKAALFNSAGEMLTERLRIKTPQPCPPHVLIDSLAELVSPINTADRVSVGFPGVVRKGIILTAQNLGSELYKGFNLAAALSNRLGKPVRVLNDADMQGYAAIEGSGMEVVITLGTGFGSSIFEDGVLGPHLELAHHPFRKGETYEEQLGAAALEDVGKKRWNRRLERAITTLRVLTNFDRLYIGGGNAKEVELDLDDDVQTVSNILGLKGGVRLWTDDAQ